MARGAKNWPSPGMGWADRFGRRSDDCAARGFAVPVEGGIPEPISAEKVAKIPCRAQAGGGEQGEVDKADGLRVIHAYLGATMNPVLQFSKAALNLGIATLCLALLAPLSAQEPKSRAILKGHVKAVESVCFSPDGKTLASACSDCSIKLWDVVSGRNTATLKESSPGAKKLPYLWATAAFSPDGKKLATGGWFNRVKVWDIATLKGQLFLEGYQQCPETWVVFSPDGKTLASGGVCRGDMILFDVASGKIKATLKTPGTFGNYNPHGVLAAAFTPDGKTLVSIAIPDEVRLWDVSTGKHFQMQQTERKIGQWTNAVASFSPDVKMVATSHYGDTSITLWEVATGKAKATLNGAEGKVWPLTFSPDGKTLASGDDKGTIKLWDVTVGKELASFTGHAGEITCLAISTDGKMLASGGKDKKIKLWDTVTPK